MSTRGKDRIFKIKDHVPVRITDEDIEDEISKCYPTTGLEGVDTVTLDPQSVSNRKFTDEYGNTSKERSRLRSRGKLPKSQRTVKKHQGWLYYQSGITDPRLIAEQCGVRQETVLKWIPEYQDNMENLVCRNALTFSRNVVTKDDVILHKENRATITNVLSDINDELLNTAVIDSKIASFLDKLDLLDIEDPKSVTQTLALIKYYADRDAIRTKKINMLLKLKVVHEEDSGITMAKKLEEERESAVRKFITNKDLQLFYERKEHKNITSEGIREVVDGVENTIAEFADFTVESKK